MSSCAQLKLKIMSKRKFQGQLTMYHVIQCTVGMSA